MVIAMARFNMIVPSGITAEVADRYRTMLEMASFMDENGFTGVTFEEQHSAENAWNPTPMMNAAMVASQNREPLYDHLCPAAAAPRSRQGGRRLGRARHCERRTGRDCLRLGLPTQRTQTPPQRSVMTSKASRPADYET